ncbi:unnamed protein product [Adineta steineri]|uniref:Uncharacterized protein n=1 Tax=Adineta steineri TaxID=433720 RepID=A0A814U343_9BILA|nr:unnamed protein product [Adineta steineri]CAF1393194.1 unnamed protein product [Adineta steineri]
MLERMLSFYIFVFVSFTAVVFQCDGAPVVYTITYQQYTTVQIGWTQQQVTQNIGSAGNLVSQTGTGNTAITIIKYTGSQSPLAVATFLFQGGYLFSKTQVGLDTTVYTITLAQYTAIEIRWTRDQATKLVGSAGCNASEAGTANTAMIIVQYKAAGTTFGIVTLGFVGGKIVSKSEIGFATTVSNKINLLQYNTIQIGWTQQQVTTLLGGSGTIVSQAGTQAAVTFLFLGGILSTKSQSGLDTGIYTMTYQQFTTIEIGWTRDQVTNVVGSAGCNGSEGGSGNTAVIVVRFTAAGAAFGNADLTFINGKLTAKTGIGYFLTISNKITLQQYNTIQLGWTQQQVTALLGGSGTLISQSGVQGSTSQTSIVLYTGGASSSASALITFQGGIVYSKTQANLDTGVYMITQQQFASLQIGWTRDQVTQFIGNAGNVASEAGTGNVAAVNVQYKVVGTVIGTVNLIFSGGKLYIKTGFGFK